MPEATPRLRRPGLAVGAVLLQAAPGLAGLDAHRHQLVLASGVLLAAWFVVNVRSNRGATRLAIAVALAGAALNLAVMLPNGGMPVSRAALAEIGGAHVDVAEGHLYKHVVVDDDTTFAVLGDVIPVPPLGLVASVGDIVLALGLIGGLVTIVGARDRARLSISTA